MSPYPRLRVTQGAYLDMDLTLLQDGTPLDLTNASSPLCQVRTLGANELIATLTAEVTDAVLGIVNLSGDTSDWPLTSGSTILICDLRLLYNGLAMYRGPWEFVVGRAVSVLA